MRSTDCGLARPAPINTKPSGGPEVLLYADDPRPGIRYPGFVEDGHRLFITTTGKKTARTRKISDWLLARLRDEETRGWVLVLRCSLGHHGNEP